MTVNMTMSMTMTMTIPCGFVDSNIQHISVATIVTLCVTMSTCRENSHTLFFSELFWWNPALGLFRPTLLIHKPIILRFIGILLKIHAGCELCLRMTLWWEIPNELHHPPSRPWKLTGISWCFPLVETLCHVGVLGTWGLLGSSQETWRIHQGASFIIASTQSTLGFSGTNQGLGLQGFSKSPRLWCVPVFVPAYLGMSCFCCAQLLLQW